MQQTIFLYYDNAGLRILHISKQKSLFHFSSTIRANIILLHYVFSISSCSIDIIYFYFVCQYILLRIAHFYIFQTKIIA